MRNYVAGMMMRTVGPEEERARRDEKMELMGQTDSWCVVAGGGVQVKPNDVEGIVGAL